MCGYCVEMAALDLIEKEVLSGAPLHMDDLHGLVLAPFTQESRYCLHNAQMARSFEALPEVLYTLHCLALGELGSVSGRVSGSVFNIAHGESLVKAALVKHLHDYRQMLSTAFPSHVELLGLLPHPEWTMLYGQEALFSEARRGAFLSDPLLQDQCTGLLKSYHDWWLQGNGLLRNDLTRRMDETGMLDPLEDIRDSEWDTLERLFPALFFALDFLGRHGRRLEVVAAVALTSPAGVPRFTGLDLWLQRRALSVMIRRQGPEFLLDNLNRDFRPLLVRYTFMRLSRVRSLKPQLVGHLQSMIRTDEQRSEFDDEAQICLDRISSWPSLSRYQ